MKSLANRSIKLLVISFVISLLVFWCFDLGIVASVYAFVYLLSLLLVPYWLTNNNIKSGMKLFSTIAIGVFGVASIAYIYGVDRTLYRYVIVFCVVVTSCIISNCIKRKKEIQE